ncbi:MAG: hypothetical protein LBD69_02890 [Puniceicoccales bacterium]|jgi:hypothetical protein|nr:hypothetical protein [Puniceicoccales bacterium]
MKRKLLFILCCCPCISYAVKEKSGCFEVIQSFIDKAYRCYWLQEIELDEKIKAYLEERHVWDSISQIAVESVNSINLENLHVYENEAYFRDYFMKLNYEELEYLLYRFYEKMFLPKEENTLNCFLGCLSWNIRRIERMDYGIFDPRINWFYKEQAKFRKALEAVKRVKRH